MRRIGLPEPWHAPTSGASTSRRSITMHSKTLTKLVTAGVVSLAALAPHAIADAARPPQVDYSGLGTYEMVEFGMFARGVGDAEGRPFDGRVTFMLRTDDGSLPAPGECEPGFANFAVTARKHHELWGTSAGDVCGQFVDAQNSATQVFTCDYSIVESTRRLSDTEGFIEIRLATGNRMAVTLFDS